MTCNGHVHSLTDLAANREANKLAASSQTTTRLKHIWSWPCLSGGKVILTGWVLKIFQILSPSTKDVLLIAEKDNILVCEGHSSTRSFAAKKPYSLPGHFVGLTMIGILPRLYSGFFHR